MEFFAEYISPFLLAILQGATEFLPVSSSGHLILLNSLFGTDIGIVFDLVLHLATLVSVVLFYRREIVEEEMAYKKSLVQINKGDIKTITRNKDGAATIIRKSINPPLTTIEDYDEIIDTIQNANLALDIMHQEKVFIFDDFVVDISLQQRQLDLAHTGLDISLGQLSLVSEFLERVIQFVCKALKHFSISFRSNCDDFM